MVCRMQYWWGWGGLRIFLAVAVVVGPALSVGLWCDALGAMESRDEGAPPCISSERNAADCANHVASQGGASAETTDVVKSEQFALIVGGVSDPTAKEPDSTESDSTESDSTESDSTESDSTESDSTERGHASPTPPEPDPTQSDLDLPEQ